MTVLFTRSFALFTLFAYLMVGSVIVRFVSSSSTEILLSINYLSLFESASVATEEVSVHIPEQKFAEIKFPVVKKTVIARTVRTPAKAKVAVSRFNLPFNELITLQPVYSYVELPLNQIAYFQAAPEMVEDKVSTKVAANAALPVTDEEPVFLDYSAPEAKPEVKTTQKTEVVDNSDQNVEAVDNSAEVVDNGRGAVEAVDNSDSFVDKGCGAVDGRVASSQPEEVNVDDLITFDYSKPVSNVTTQAPQVAIAVPVATPMASTDAAPASSVTTQPLKETTVKVSVAPQKKNAHVTDEPPKQTEEHNALMGFVAGNEYSSEVTIKATATDLKRQYDVKNFEVRAQDDLNLTFDDYGSGSVTMKDNLAKPRMTRSVAILRKGLVPTNTDLIFENGVSDISLPLIDEEVFNDLIAPFEARGIVGAVLVELDDETEAAMLDAPTGRVLFLDGDLKQTAKEDYRYQLFMGVKAGNVLLSYKTIKGKVLSKIIHVHERELTYDSNFYEELSSERIALFEEGLLGQEKSPLIIGGSHVRKFASEETSRKISDNIYKLNYDSGLLASRRYLELTHQSEPVFVGVRDNKSVTVPSESFMRHVLSQLEGKALANRCLVQVNLDTVPAKIDVAPESAGNNLMTYTQLLDSDGKFYDSVSSKSRKIIIVGESQGSGDYGHDAKINIRIENENGTVQYLSSYCSPNTYLVEQL